jgi:prevent-host-death family protein
MQKTYTATQARIHFGELMRQAKEGVVIVERDGKPEVVVLSKQAYDQLLVAGERVGWRELLAEAHARVRTDLRHQQLPDPTETLNRIRQERDEHTTYLR